ECCLLLNEQYRPPTRWLISGLNRFALAMVRYLPPPAPSSQLSSQPAYQAKCGIKCWAGG
ncbi:MAG: hypothetical protein QME90_19735, partial [Thermodesulfobacteriota bacterium]|nr:hypothetical protein [Thermodesulfobacteriota bacterium]